MTELPGGTVTLLFTDIELSTKTLREIGSLYPELLELHRRMLEEAVTSASGQQVETRLAAADAPGTGFLRTTAVVPARRSVQLRLEVPKVVTGFTLGARAGSASGPDADGTTSLVNGAYRYHILPNKSERTSTFDPPIDNQGAGTPSSGVVDNGKLLYAQTDQDGFPITGFGVNMGSDNGGSSTVDFKNFTFRRLSP